MRGYHCLFSCQHLIRITSDRINFTIMHNETVRMRSLPAGIGVRTESGVYGSNRRFIVRGLKICKESTKLANQKHPFIHDGPAGKRYHIGIIITLFKYTARYIKPSVKVQTFLYIIWFFDKCLHNTGHTFQCFVSQYLRTVGTALHPRSSSPSFSTMISNIFFA